MKSFECRNINKQYGDFSISQISFQFQMGEIIGVIGANGAGKTTLFNIINGRYRLEREGHKNIDPDSGHISLCGYDMDQDQKNFRRSLIYIDAQSPYHGMCCPSEIGELYGSYYPQYSSSVFESCLRDFHLDEKKKIRDMSTGETIKLQLAFAFAANVPLLILDEPAANLDKEFREEFYDRLRDYVSDQEHAVLIASHIVEELERIADRILWIERKDKTGQMSYFGTLDDLRENYRIFKAVPNNLEHLVIGGRKTENTGEYLINVASMNREDILRMKNDPNYDLRYPTLTEILYYCTKNEVAYE